MKPNEPLGQAKRVPQSGCKSEKCVPRKDATQIQTAESWLNRDPKTVKVEIPAIAKVEIPEPPKTVSLKRPSGIQYHCKRCDKDVVGGRCECRSGPSPWAPKEKKPRNIWRWLTALLLLFILIYHSTSVNKIAQQEETIDSLLELLEEVTTPLPQGNGETETPGVLPPKGWVNPNTII